MIRTSIGTSDDPGDDPGSDEERSLARSLPGRLLQVPLFHKVLLANAAVVLLAMVAATLLTVTQYPAVRHDALPLPLAGLGLLALALSAGINAVILRAALAPLLELENTARRVEQGELGARARPSSLADRELSRLTTVFNSMLDTLETHRRSLRKMTARALSAQERERAVIARKLQDDAAQRLALLLLRLRVATRRAERGSEELDLTELREEMGDLLDRVNHIARELRPPELDDLGVVAAIQKLARRLQEESGLQVDCRAEDVDAGLSAHRSLALYRIVQEALVNAVHHAEAQTLTVQLARDGQKITAVVEDDGRGFSLDQELRGGGESLGLRSMSERAAFVGGEVSLRSEPGVGTTVRVEIPAARHLGDDEQR